MIQYLLSVYELEGQVEGITCCHPAIRVVTLGGPTASHVAYAVTWLAGLLILIVPTAVIRYRHTTQA